MVGGRLGRSSARSNQPEAHLLLLGTHLLLPESLLLLPRRLLQELEPLAPPRTVDYEVETDELALLQVGEGGAWQDVCRLGACDKSKGQTSWRCCRWVW